MTPAVKRQAVAHLCAAYEVSQRRACRTMGAELRDGRRFRILAVPVVPHIHVLQFPLKDLAIESLAFSWSVVSSSMCTKGFAIASLLNWFVASRYAAPLRWQSDDGNWHGGDLSCCL